TGATKDPEVEGPGRPADPTRPPPSEASKRRKVTTKNHGRWIRDQVMDWATDGGTIRRLYNDNLKRAQIPVPDLDEQERVVSVLDAFDALVNGLSVGLPAELTARRQQYEFYRDRLLTFDEVAS
ncbi:restriction endonuclease subunit S, partial [Propioniciclava sp. MC1683]|uniref:restriction endonuclease subunit S n=1 Tax=Propioniciclava sp. MC1683 TaxID=2760309 RepID=UPI0016003D2D